MSLIHLYLDKEDKSSKLITLLKKQNINFLQTNLDNNNEYLKVYSLEQLPAIKFKDMLTYDTSEESVNEIIDKFNDFIHSLPNINMDTGHDNIKPFKRVHIKNIKSDDKTKLASFIKSKIK